MATIKVKFLLPLAIGCLVLTGCFSRSAAMTYNDYDCIEIGTSISEVQTDAGRPYAIHAKEGGNEEYEYVEKIDSGSGLMAENHYFIIVKNGKVIGKYMKRERPPAYDLIYLKEPNYTN